MDCTRQRRRTSQQTGCRAAAVARRGRLRGWYTAAAARRGSSAARASARGAGSGVGGLRSDSASAVRAWGACMECGGERERRCDICREKTPMVAVEAYFHGCDRQYPEFGCLT